MSLFFSPLQVSPELMELSGLSISSRHNILTNQIGEAYHFARIGNSSGTFCSLRIYSDDTTQKGIDFFVVEEETGQRLVIEAFDSAKPYFGVFGSSDEPLQLTPSIELGSCMSGDKIHAAVARVLDHFHYFGFENTLEYFTTLPLVFVEASELRETSLQSVIRHRLLSANQNIHLIECHIDETGAGSLDASLEVRLPASLSIFPIIETLENWRDFRGEHPTRLSLEYLMYTDTTHRITKLDYSSIAENVCVSLCAHDRRKLQDPAVSMLSDIETFVAYRRGFQPIAWAVCDERSYVERMYLLLKGNGEGRLFAMDKVGEVYEVSPDLMVGTSGSSDRLMRLVKRIENANHTELKSFSIRSEFASSNFHLTLDAATIIFDACRVRPSLPCPSVVVLHDGVDVSVSLMGLEVSFRFQAGYEYAHRVVVKWNREANELASIFRGPIARKTFNVRLSPEQCFALIEKVNSYYNASGLPRDRAHYVADLLGARR